MTSVPNFAVRNIENYQQQVSYKGTNIMMAEGHVM